MSARCCHGAFWGRTRQKWCGPTDPTPGAERARLVQLLRAPPPRFHVQKCLSPTQMPAAHFQQIALRSAKHNSQHLTRLMQVNPEQATQQPALKNVSFEVLKALTFSYFSLTVIKDKQGDTALLCPAHYSMWNQQLVL